MSEMNSFSGAQLRTPKAAAIAGIVFSALLLAIIWLLRRSLPADPLDPGAWLATESNTVALALNMIPFRRDCLPVVYRRAAGPPRSKGRSLLCHSIFRQRAVVSCHAVCGRGNRRGCYPGRLVGEPNRAGQFWYFSPRAGDCLYHDQCLRDQDGRRIHDLDVDGCDLHSNSTAVDRFCRLRVGLDSSDRQLLHQLERRGLAHLGLVAQRSYPCRQYGLATKYQPAIVANCREQPMPKVETSTPPHTPTPIGPYNHIAKVGSFITIGGVAGFDPATGQLAGSDIAAQTRQILTSFKTMLASSIPISSTRCTSTSSCARCRILQP